MTKSTVHYELAWMLPAPLPTSQLACERRSPHGRLMPNERLIEADLAQSFGVNRANIRMALAMLDQEGRSYASSIAARRVRLVSDAEAIEIAETRLAIEVMVARPRRRTARHRCRPQSATRRIEADMRARGRLSADYALSP